MTKHIKNPRTLKTFVAVAAAPALLLGVAACSDSDDSAPETVTQTVENNSTPSSEPSTSSAPAAAPAGDAPEILLNGAPVEGDFTPVRCENGEDDGRPQVEYEAGKDDSADKLQVDIYTEDPLTLDEIELDNAGIEWEADDAEEQAATVERNGEEFTITSTVHQDDNEGETAEVKVTFTCAGA